MDSSSSPTDIPCGYVCTHAITGSNHPAHQSIYICETCRLPSSADDAKPSSNNIAPDGGDFCICESCAEVCHANHNVEFVGVGPCTCDCFRLCATDQQDGESSGKKQSEYSSVCKLVEVSREEAQLLGFNDSNNFRKLNEPIPRMIPPVCTLLPTSDDAGFYPNEEIDNLEEDCANETHPREDVAELITPQCVECNSSMGGYIFDSFTIAELTSSSNHGVEHCQSLIRQAEALVDESRDTFWIPIDVSGSNNDTDHELCDLEILAREIYLRHVKAYNLHPEPGVKQDADEDNAIPGAEWWVQVKPEGSSKTPVDVHYDKDEALAEAFCLGSFPTLSTVTYLTGTDSNQDGENQLGGMDVAPTVVFPHTYHDDEDQPITAMLLSHPVRGKHLVFDGRLLHGAPGHPALRLRREENAKANIETNTDSNPLRVTFLVNIWRTGKPAGVHVLPQSIRTKIMQSVSDISSEQQLFPSLPSLKFEKRLVPQYNTPSKLSLAFSAENPMDLNIVLPFVSKSATWISDGEAEETEELKSNSYAAAEISTKSIEEDGETAGEENEEDDELYLQLPQFAAPEYLKDCPDTAMFLFQAGNEARLMRGVIGGGNDMEMSLM